MSTPVVTNTWAGNFDCDVCRRKRLMAEEFSKKALEKHRKTGSPLKCKPCVAAAAQAERNAAAAKRATTTKTRDDKNNNNNNNNTHTNTTIEEETRVCASCQQTLTADAYNRNQWNNKAAGISKCRSCVEAAWQTEQARQQEESAAAPASVVAAKQRLAGAAATTPTERLAAESVVAAWEAQKVTGLAPVRLGRGRARGRGRTRGSSRGRGGGGPGRR